jgi:hypothetical protein
MEDARAHGVHADVLGGVIQGDLLGETVDAVLGGGVGGDAREADEAGYRGAKS